MNYFGPEIKKALKIILRLDPFAHVVGGAIRDIILKKDRITDIDVIVTQDGLALARAAADEAGPDFAFVPLDPDHGVGRIVLKSPQLLYIDLSSFKHPNLLEDLRKRDFTINALALKLDEFIEERWENIIDPTGGLNDIRLEVIRACSRDSFVDDPLRILRAFRFAALLGYVIDPETLDLLRRSLAELPAVAPERIREELILMLASENGFVALDLMSKTGALRALFPELLPMQGCGQNNFHHLDVWDHSLEAVNQVEHLIANDAAAFGEVAGLVSGYLSESIVYGRPRAALIKIAALFHDSGKPRSKFIDSTGRARFFGHEKISGEIIAAAAERLKFSNREKKFLADIVTGHMRPIVFVGRSVSKRAVLRLYHRFDRDIIGLLVLFMGDLQAARGPARKPGENETALQRVVAGLDAIFNQELNPREPIITGADLMIAFRLKPGPAIGKILTKLAAMQAEGLIGSTQQALITAQTLLDEMKHRGELG
jgi:poly(A) polymerase